MRRLVVLPAPLGPEQRVELARAQRKIEPAHGRLVVGLGEAFDRQGVHAVCAQRPAERAR